MLAEIGADREARRQNHQTESNVVPCREKKSSVPKEPDGRFHQLDPVAIWLFTPRERAVQTAECRRAVNVQWWRVSLDRLDDVQWWPAEHVVESASVVVAFSVGPAACVFVLAGPAAAFASNSLSGGVSPGRPSDQMPSNRKSLLDHRPDRPTKAATLTGTHAARIHAFSRHQILVTLPAALLLCACQSLPLSVYDVERGRSSSC